MTTNSDARDDPSPHSSAPGGARGVTLRDRGHLAPVWTHEQRCDTGLWWTIGTPGHGTTRMAPDATLDRLLNAADQLNRDLAGFFGEDGDDPW